MMNCRIKTQQKNFMLDMNPKKFSAGLLLNLYIIKAVPFLLITWLYSRGVSSTVRRCIEKETGVEFAAKIIDLSNDPESREATMEEINILRMVIGHDYISKYII